MENIFFITAAQPNLCTHTHAHTHAHTHTHTHTLYYTTSALLHKTFSKQHSQGWLFGIFIKNTLPHTSLSDPFLQYTTKEDTLRHEAYNFRYSIFTHIIQFFIKQRKKEKSLPATFRQTRTICHTGEESRLKRVFFDGGD